ncbi:MAG: DUF1971 domain-containing protein [Deltaproteobacteria bacterium]|nr:DUF1971 domain-containing protein [Deltaproteobacteria bacterium]
MNVDLDDAQLGGLVDTFYARVRLDPLIGDVFNRAVADWGEHLETLTRFWSSVMLGSGRYKGNPVAQHLKHVRELTPPMFERWLELWSETTTAVCSPANASALQAKARRIGESLQLALEFHRDAPPSPAWRSLPMIAQPVPYKRTAIFDQDTLPAALRKDHRTKAGVWGVIRVLDGSLVLHLTDPEEAVVVDRQHPAVLRPEQLHHVEVQSPMRMQIEFYDAAPGSLR